MQREIYRKVRAAAVPAIAVIGLGVVMTAQGFTGAIFSTNRDGSFVNGNVYDDKDDPYLNGGPRANANCSASGLPDGDYFFQVTDPSGSVLLSSDAVDPNRRVTVSAGHIVAASGTHAPFECFRFDRSNRLTQRSARSPFTNSQTPTRSTRAASAAVSQTRRNTSGSGRSGSAASRAASSRAGSPTGPTAGSSVVARVAK